MNIAESVNERVKIDDEDKVLLDELQVEFPVTLRPYAAVAKTIASTEASVIDRVNRLRDSGIIRQISAIFDTRKLGYESTLIAAELPPDRLEAGAAVVSAHPGVSHNYERDHRYNLWFTLATPPGEDLAAAADDLAGKAGFVRYLILPAIRTFRIGVRLGLNGRDRRPVSASDGPSHPGPLTPLTERDKAFVRVLQEDFPVVAEPFAPMAVRLIVTQDALLDWIRRMTDTGRIRRVAAVLHHRAVGFAANAMVVWAVPSARVEAVGRFCAEIPEISHCYERPMFEDWPYNLFTMIHGRETSDCDRVVCQVVKRFGDVDREILYSTREFKKERVKYFV